MNGKQIIFHFSRLGPAVVLILFLAATFSPELCAAAPLSIDLQAIRLIESSDSPVAVNEATGCYGLYQISGVCLEDYNQSEGAAYQVRDLFDPRTNERIAAWYFKRIARMLKHFDIPVNLTTVLASYNWGIGHVVAWYRDSAAFQDLPRETRQYIRKYRRLTQATS